ncbi:protein-tyrosine kinase [Alistipes senegalensis]|uniref:protein-tyrosine kinase n=1 Tax=Alistipes senegalensis TaxID=1288121 RepID=UPI002431433D|nr:protein-tyrosine kinase [Alistipes senegalensis]
MRQGTISIENNTVNFNPDSDGDIWLAQFEIAHLFGVFVSAVSANIRAIYKSGALKEYETQRVEKIRDGCYLESYNMEMIIALAFRLRSRQTSVFRRWLTHRPQSRMFVVKVSDNEHGAVS